MFSTSGGLGDDSPAQHDQDDPRVGINDNVDGLRFAHDAPRCRSQNKELCAGATGELPGNHLEKLHIPSRHPSRCAGDRAGAEASDQTQ